MSTTPPPSRWRTAVIWLGVVALLALFAWGLNNNTERRPQVGDLAPDFQAYFYEGYGWEEAADPANVMLADMQGKVVVINFWASWCLPCHEEADDLEALWQKYREQDVVFLGIAYIDTEPKALEFLEQYAITYPNGPDLQSRITGRYFVKQVPETFVVDSDGRLAFIRPGPITAEELEQVLVGLVGN